MHFYESSIITTLDGMHCQVYGNEHPLKCILVKPKYVPTDKINSDAFQYRFISGKRMNRLNLWADKAKLVKYIADFRANYPEYVFESQIHEPERLFFCVPIEKIERVYFPAKGLSELMDMPKESLDEHLKNVHEFVMLLLSGGLRLKDLGVTYSTLMGHYLSNRSDINIVIYGKDNFWKAMEFLEKARHPKLSWKTSEDWLRFYSGRNRFNIFSQEEFLRVMQPKRSEGFFDGTLFLIFGAEKEDEVWFKWGEERYHSLGNAVVEAEVIDNFSSVVRPGCYVIANARITEGGYGIDQTLVKKIAFYSRDYCMIARKGEHIRACGVLEKVEKPGSGAYYRIVVGYFDTYLTERREREFIKVVNNG